MSNIQLAKNLKYLREKSNLKQEDIGDIINLTRQAYSNYENQTRTPDIDTLMILSNYYNVSLNDLIFCNLSESYIPFEGLSEGEIPYICTKSEKDDVTVDVPAPTFLLNLTAGEYDVNTEDTYDEDKNSYALQVQAVGSGNVTYVLKKATPGSNIWVNQDNSTIKIEYRKTQDTTRNPSKIYYTPVTKEGVLAYEVYPSEFDANSNGGVYEQYCVAFVSAPGDYLIQAKNRVGISSKSLDSNRVTFPKPVAPVINTEVIGALLNENNQTTLEIEYLADCPTGQYTYNWTGPNGAIPEANGESVTITTEAEESIYHVTVTNRRNNESVSSGKATYRVTKPAQTPEILAPVTNSNVAVNTTLTVEVKTEGVPFDDIQVQWYKSEDLNMDNLEGDTKCGDPVSAISGLASFTPTEGGLYYATVTLKRNISEAAAISPTWSVIG